MSHESALLPTDLELPPILHGQSTPHVEERVHKFLFSVAAIYESWLGRRTSPHTRRSYDQDVMNFARGYLGLRWPEDAAKFLQVSVQTVQVCRTELWSHLLCVPGQIVIAFVAELSVYRFWCTEGRIPELQRILEKRCAASRPREPTRAGPFTVTGVSR